CCPAVGKPGEMQIAPVDEGRRAVLPRQAHCGIAARHHERADAAEYLGPLFFPPEDLGSVIEARGAAGLPEDLRACLLLEERDVRRAAGVQPGVVWGDVSAVFTDSDDPRH